jgi:hypothetical protein
MIAAHITNFKKNDKTGLRRIWTYVPANHTCTLTYAHFTAHCQLIAIWSNRIQFVPRRTVLCERVLAEEGVFGDVRTGK